MGYADYLKQMLRPMGVYRLDGGYSSSELDAVGDALDKVCAELDLLLERNADYIKRLEALFPIVDFASGEAERESNVLTLMSVNDEWSDKASLEAILSACGLAADISETDDKFVLEVRFKDIRGELTSREKQVCRDIMPAHIALRLICDGLTWDRAEELFPTWDDFDNAGLTASELVKLA
ncbi:MAG: hypothetical protein IJ017_07170 [Oscillospiraceae bacterium]|nr:hypothetical protein [Oscillospiraceae bacterium]